jgi:MFS family permease
MFNNSRCLLICLTLIGLCLGAVVNGLVPVSITTLERRFELTSVQTGMFAGAYKLSSMLSVIPIAHFSSKGVHKPTFILHDPCACIGHKGRYLSYGSLCLGLGSLMIVLPQFVSGPYNYEHVSAANTLCTASNTNRVHMAHTGVRVTNRCRRRHRHRAQPQTCTMCTM